MAAEGAVLDHLGEHIEELAILDPAREEEDALVLADVYRQGRGHGGEDDRLVERYQPIIHNQSTFCS